MTGRLRIFNTTEAEGKNKRPSVFLPAKIKFCFLFLKQATAEGNRKLILKAKKQLTNQERRTIVVL